LASHVKGGGKLVITGENATGFTAGQNVSILPNCPGKAHMSAVERDMTASDRTSEEAFFNAIGTRSELLVEAPPLVATQIASVEGKPHIFLANFSGLIPGKNAKQSPVAGIKIRVTGPSGVRLTFLPFLGEPQTIEGERTNAGTLFQLPRLDKGAVAWIEPAK